MHTWTIAYFRQWTISAIIYYLYFIVYDHVYAFGGDWHSFQVIANVVLFTLSDFKLGFRTFTLTPFTLTTS